MDGRWGTVCNNRNQNSIAEVVCSKLGFPAQGDSQLESFETPHAQNIYYCIQEQWQTQVSLAEDR